MSKEQRVNIRVKETTIKELKEVATALEIPAAQIVRDGIREKLDTLKRTDPRLNELQAQVTQN